MNKVQRDTCTFILLYALTLILIYSHMFLWAPVLVYCCTLMLLDSYQHTQMHNPFCNVM